VKTPEDRISPPWLIHRAGVLEFFGAK